MAGPWSVFPDGDMEALPDLCVCPWCSEKQPLALCPETKCLAERQGFLNEQWIERRKSRPSRVPVRFRKN